MLKSLLQFGDGLQFLFIIISIPSAKLCSTRLSLFFSLWDLHYAYFRSYFSDNM